MSAETVASKDFVVLAVMKDVSTDVLGGGDVADDERAAVVEVAEVAADEQAAASIATPTRAGITRPRIRRRGLGEFGAS